MTLGDLEIIRHKVWLILEQVPCLKQLKNEVPGVVFGITWEPFDDLPDNLKITQSLLLTLCDVPEQRLI